MEWEIIHIAETDSTNRWLRERGGEGDMVVVADYQTAGKGQGTNSWESERGKNLLFSVLYHPQRIPANRQFHISMAVSLAIADALGEHIGDVSIKWPNDIYWRNAKICGILIENRLLGQTIRDSIIGVGVNVNQRQFHSNAPNPVSLWQIHGHETDLELLLQSILDKFTLYINKKEIKTQYLHQLYRRKGFHPYADREGSFMAEIVDVEDDGHLLLCDDNGQQRRYAFKEVSFVI
ncbi:MAG: biotin--[acetyl-CoA-carboxylase] ligase [Prevotella sp.]|nr:biotin--[acetyl-CoA-carboxylase] ligase [Prevotella sp.]